MFAFQARVLRIKKGRPWGKENVIYAIIKIKKKCTKSTAPSLLPWGECEGHLGGMILGEQVILDTTMEAARGYIKNRLRGPMYDSSHHKERQSRTQPAVLLTTCGSSREGRRWGSQMWPSLHPNCLMGDISHSCHHPGYNKLFPHEIKQGSDLDLQRGE